MSTTNTPALTTNALFAQDNVRAKFEEMLGKRAPQFITSVLQIASQNELLAKADPMSIFNAAAVAATLDLPLNNNIGFAYIIAFNNKQKDGTFKVEAQFQIGWRGFVQLAQRTGQFKTISACPIYEGQIKSHNPLTGIEFDFNNKISDTVVGYASYFSLINGFEKTFYMTVDELKKHGAKFSKTYQKGYGLWKDDFDSMAQKTVIKLLLSKFAPLSIEMQKAIHTDQAIIKDDSGERVEYADHEEIQQDTKAVIERKETQRILDHILQSESLDDLSMVESFLNDQNTKDAYDKKLKEIKGKK